MDATVYYFGKEQEAYYQYPTDYTEDYFRKELTKSQNKAQIAIHRDGNLLFYSYIRQLDNKEAKIGICLVTDYIILDYKKLFETFETFFAILSESGTIIKYDDNGRVILNSHPFSDEKVYLEELSNEIEAFAAEIPNSKRRNLPQQDFSISKDDCKELSLEDGDIEIALALEHYSNVYLSTTRLEIERVTSWGAQIREKTERIHELEAENEKVKKQKKQYRLVSLMALILMGCVVGLIAFNNNIKDLRSELEDKKSTIRELRSEISEKTNTISELNTTVSKKNSEISVLKKNISGLQTQIEQLEEDKEALKKTVSELPPLLISELKMGIVNRDGDTIVDYGSTINSSNTMYLSPKIYYYGTRTGSITLKTKIFTPSGALSYNSSISPEGFTNKTEMYVAEGSHSIVMTGWGSNNKGHWSAGNYRIEIWYSTTCLYSKSFKIN